MSTPNLNWQYRDNFYALCPTWLQQGYGEKYMYVFEAMRDFLVDKASQGVLFRMPGLADPSQLPYLAYDRQLVQGPAEGAASFAARLRGAIQQWGLAGSRRAVLAAVQGYLQGLQPGAVAGSPGLAVVGGNFEGGVGFTTWDTLANGAALGALPVKTLVAPIPNWNWDGQNQPWRNWLVLAMQRVATGVSGSGAATTGTYPGSFSNEGQNVGGVWVPATVATDYVGANPFVLVGGLSGITPAMVGQWLTLSGMTQSGNNGSFPITEWVSATQVIVANPAGVNGDTGGTWSLSAYPFLAPAPVWGAGLVFGVGYTIGQGQVATPPDDQGTNVGGVWQPTITGAGAGASLAWGLACNATPTLIPSQVMQSVRQLVKQCKSAATFYSDLIVSFDGGTGAAGSSFSPLSNQGAGNPDHTFGSEGQNVAGVWVPTRTNTGSLFDCYCAGTGQLVACTVPNVT